MSKQHSINMEHILTQSDGVLANIIQAYQQTCHINNVFKQYAPEHISKHCKVGLFHQNILVLHAKSNAWAAKLRLLKSDLLSILRQAPEFRALVRIDIQIMPSTVKHKKSTQNAKDQQQDPRQIPQQALDIAKQWAISTDDNDLKKHLALLIKHHKV